MKKFYNGSFEQLTRVVYTKQQGLCENAKKVCCIGDTFFIAGDSSVYKLKNGVFEEFADFSDSIITNIRVVDENLYVMHGNYICLLKSDGIETTVFSEKTIDICIDKDNVTWVLTEANLYKKENGKFTALTGVPGNARCITAFNNNKVYTAADCGLLALTGKRWHWSELTCEWSGLISDNVKCVKFDTIGNIWVATDKGVCVYDDNDCWKTPETVKNLPSGDICDMVFAKDGTKYFASTTGIIILKNGELKYYGYKRWVPHPSVISVAVNSKNELAALTPEGLSIITPTIMTLEEKANIYDEMIVKYFTRKDGYMDSRYLDTAGDLDSGHLESGDNDGLFTGLYVAAQSFKYNVTGDRAALERARKSLKAMFKLIDICGDSGFVARAIRYSDECDFETGVRHEWRRIDADTEWLGETSSDEITGHMYAYSIFFDLCADESEKAEIQKYVRLIIDHILNNSFHLIDTDGKPTTWANWEPSSLNNDNKWIFEKGINSLEILSYLISAYHITNDKKYYDVFYDLVKKHHYDLNVMKHKVEDGHITHIDDRLGFYVVYPLLKYVEEPDLAAIIKMGLFDHWQYERIEHTPLYNAVYGYFTGSHCDIEAAAKSLEECPLDTIYWPMYNSYIKSLVWDDQQEKYGNPPQLKEPLPGYIRPVCLCDGNPFVCDTGEDDFMLATEVSNGLFWSPSRRGDNGMRAMNPTIYILAYWAARYFGLLGD